MVGITAVGRMALFVAAILVAAGTAGAHVILDHPNGGETFAAGTVVVVEWHVHISHDTVDWDLWYSVTGPGGPWIEIAADLPPGDTSTGAIHTFDWTVPTEESDLVRIRVRQDNNGSDYEDISDADLRITEVLFEDGFESGNTGRWSTESP